MKAFLASPYRSHVCFNTHGREAPLRDAMLAVIRLSRRLHPVFSADEVSRMRVPCIWSPLIEGDILRAEGRFIGEKDALEWCLAKLESCGFTHLIMACDDTIPRADGYGPNGCDVEEARAKDLGIKVIREMEFQHAR